MRIENVTDKITLYNCDCMEYMKNIPDKYFDLAICDPPYGINRSGQSLTICKNKKHNRKYFENRGWDNKTPTKEYFDELFRVSKNQIIWGANYFVKYMMPKMGWIVWDKGQYGLSMSDGELAYSSFDKALRIITINRCELAKEGTIHPTQKPVKLYEWLLKNYAKPTDKIIDTHFGSCSIGIACHNFGCTLDACEIDEEYFDKAYKRLRTHVRQLDLFK